MSEMKTTKDYGKFKFQTGQRPVNLETPEAKALRRSMRAYGFLPAFPMMVRRNGSSSSLVIVDGQHRFAIARELGLPVHYVIDDTDVDVTAINQGQRKWTLSDYIHRWSVQGVDSYLELTAFHEQYGIPVQICAAILAGTASSNNVRQAVMEGRFKIKTRELAHRVASSIQALAKINPRVAKKNSFVQALWACYFVDYFDDSRLVDSFRKRPDALQNAGDREGFLDMIHEAYNFARRSRVPLKFDAQEAMRQRIPIGKRGESDD